MKNSLIVLMLFMNFSSFANCSKLISRVQRELQKSGQFISPSHIHVEMLEKVEIEQGIYINEMHRHRIYANDQEFLGLTSPSCRKVLGLQRMNIRL